MISVAYRVNSKRGVRFRQWATRVLNEHLTRGYTVNRQRLETNPPKLEAALRYDEGLLTEPVYGLGCVRQSLSSRLV